MSKIKLLHEKLAEFDALPYPKPDFGEEIATLLIDVLKDKNSYYSACITDIEEGSYFGVQCAADFSESPMGGVGVKFEIAWDYNQISVYSANHDGYWVAPYTTKPSVLTAWRIFLKSTLFVD